MLVSCRKDLAFKCAAGAARSPLYYQCSPNSITMALCMRRVAGPSMGASRRVAKARDVRMCATYKVTFKTASGSTTLDVPDVRGLLHRHQLTLIGPID